MENNELLRAIVTDKGVMIETDGKADGPEIMSALIKINLAIITQVCKPERKLKAFKAVSEVILDELKNDNYLNGIHHIHTSCEEESEKIREDFAKGGVFGDGKLH